MGAAVTRVYLADTRQTRRYSSPLAKYSLLHARALHTKRPLAATNPNSQSDDYFSRGCNDTRPHCPRVQTAVRPVITLDKVTEDFVLLQTAEFSSCVFLSLSLTVCLLLFQTVRVRVRLQVSGNLLQFTECLLSDYLVASCLDDITLWRTKSFDVGFAVAVPRAVYLSTCPPVYLSICPPVRQ